MQDGTDSPVWRAFSAQAFACSDVLNGWVLLRLLALFLQVVRLRPESVAIFNTEAAHKSHKSSGVSSVCSCQALEVEEEDILSLLSVGLALGFRVLLNSKGPLCVESR